VLVRGGAGLKVGEFARVRIERADAFDLVAVPANATLSQAPLRPAPGRRMHRVISRV